MAYVGFLRWPCDRPRVHRARTPGRVSGDFRTARHAPVRARRRGARGCAGALVAGRARRSQRRLDAAVALHPDHRSAAPRTHPRPGRRRARAHRASAGSARRGISAAQGRGHSRMRRAAGGGAVRRPRPARLRPAHAAADGPRVGVLRDPEPVAGGSVRRPRHGLGVPVRPATAGRPAGDAGRRRAGGRPVPGPGTRVSGSAGPGIGRLGLRATAGGIRLREPVGSSPDARPARRRGRARERPPPCRPSRCNPVKRCGPGQCAATTNRVEPFGPPSMHANAPRSSWTRSNTSPPSATRTQQRSPTSAYHAAPSRSRQMPSGECEPRSAQTRRFDSEPSASMSKAVSRCR